MLSNASFVRSITFARFFSTIGSIRAFSIGPSKFAEQSQINQPSQAAAKMQSMLGSEVSRPIDDLVTLDHRSFDELYDRYRSTIGNLQEQQKIANELIREIAIHSAGEEMTLYGAVEKHRGVQTANHLRSEHQEVKELLYTMNKMKVGTQDYDALMAQVMQELSKHAKEEEEDILPWLRTKIGQEAMIDLGKQFMGAKRTAPTRPHPSAPDKPWSEFLAGMFATPVDKLRDTTREFAERRVPEE